jgi:hypothetical protein
LLKQEDIHVFIIRIETIGEQMNLFFTPTDRHFDTRQELNFLTEILISRFFVPLYGVVISD